MKSARDCAGTLVGALLVLVAINAYPLWQPLTAGVVTEEWPRILWAADLSLDIQICSSLLLLCWRPRWLCTFFEMMFTAAGLLSVAVFLVVFPLEFSLIVGEWLNTLVWAILIISIVGAAIAVVVNLVRFLAFSWRGE